MTFFEKIWAHRGGLVRLSTQLYWYGRGWDGTPGRVCLLLDAVPINVVGADARTAEAVGVGAARVGGAFDAHLLIDGHPRWVWVTEKDVEVIDEAG